MPEETPVIRTIFFSAISNSLSCFCHPHSALKGQADVVEGSGVESLESVEKLRFYEQP
jgi:hypothetical protein